MTDAITTREMLERAARGVGKVDLLGRRGITLASMDEIEAMALTLACLGVVAIQPGQTKLPARLFVPDGVVSAELYAVEGRG
ncbi:hypothetical protein ACTTAI_19290 [Rhodobacter capsulatus]|uniref:hypothetical protein n=1 Tax=Rhodobacter capsulatus TaxID=1061 RepID=UPI004029FB7C